MIGETCRFVCSGIGSRSRCIATTGDPAAKRARRAKGEKIMEQGGKQRGEERLRAVGSVPRVKIRRDCWRHTV